jgi:2,3,4,5-tetrahydropyridine-2-carboxylate N-succinyltransferase
MSEVFAFGVGHANYSATGKVLDCFFAQPVIHPDKDFVAVVNRFPNGTSEITTDAAAAANQATGGRLFPDALLEADQPLVVVKLATDGAITDTAQAYLKLHLLSHRLTLPNTLNLDGIFAHLPNLAWTSQGPVELESLTEQILKSRLQGRHLEVMSLDKFPKMVNYVMPTGVRIADASRIRLGAYLGEGTTVMHEGFVNFNAGAMGPNMVEGRISQGVIIDSDTDLGGSSSTMGTLSGGGEITIRIGKSCLIGANAGTGIPLGDRCTIEAGLYITAGTVVTVQDEDGKTLQNIKARDLAGASDLLFIRNSQTGQVLCRTNRQAIALNKNLHAHN